MFGTVETGTSNMPLEFAGVVTSPLLAIDIERLCKGRIELKRIRTFKSSSPETTTHILEFKSRNDMINACSTDLLDLSVLPMKGQKPVSRTTFVAHPQSAGNLASATIQVANEVTGGLCRIQQSVHDAVQKGTIRPSAELRLQVTRVYSTSLSDIPRKRRDRACASAPASALLALEGKGSESLVRMLDGALVESSVESTTDKCQPREIKLNPQKKGKHEENVASKAGMVLKPQTQPHVQASPVQKQDTHAANAASDAGQVPKPQAQPHVKASPQPHKLAIAAEATTQNDERSRCSTPVSNSQHTEAVKWLQEQLPESALLHAVRGKATARQHRRLFAVPTELTGHLVGKKYAHLTSIKTASGVNNIRVADEATKANLLHPSLTCIAIDASTQAKADDAVAMLYLRLAHILAIHQHTGFCGQGPSWTPPPPSVPHRAVGPTSYGASSQEDNAALRFARATIEAVARAAAPRGGGTGGGGGGKGGKSKNKRKGRELPEVREQRRQDKDRCASPEGSDGGVELGFCLLCLDASPSAASNAAGGGEVLVAERTIKGNAGKKGGSGRNKQGMANQESGNRFAALPVEGLVGQPTKDLEAQLKRGIKALRAMNALAAQQESGTVLDGQQLAKLGRRALLQSEIETIKEILKDRTEGGEAH